MLQFAFQVNVWNRSLWIAARNWGYDEQVNNDTWPSLPFPDWKDTYATLHLWTQIVGKIRLVQSPWINHSWHSTLYVTARGLTTSPIAYENRIFQIDFDFIDHKLLIQTAEGDTKQILLQPRSVADFYRELMRKLSEVGLEITIHTMPNEIPEAIKFEDDESHASYDAVFANRCWTILSQVDRVMKKFRARFTGKCSPVHFFWGAFDLAVTRFSGRPAPQHPGGVPYLPDWVAREAYSHEVSSCGFWPGGEVMPEPVFYAYSYPEHPGFSGYKIRPASARYDQNLREFLLSYEEVRRSSSPDETLMDFFQSTYEAAADTGGWPRGELEQKEKLPPG